METTPQRVKDSVLRMAPCLPGLFSVVALIFAEHARRHRVAAAARRWRRKGEPTFSDAIATVRRLFRTETILRRPSDRKAFQEPPRGLRTMLLDCLTQAA